MNENVHEATRALHPPADPPDRSETCPPACLPKLHRRLVAGGLVVGAASPALVSAGAAASGTWHQLAIEPYLAKQDSVGFVAAAAPSENGDGEARILRTPVPFGRAVNKIRIVRGAGVTRAFAIGRDVYRAEL